MSALLTLASALWLAQAPAPAADAPAAAVAPAQPSATEAYDARRFEALEEQLAETRARLEALETKRSWFSKLSASLSGYLDFGFFWVQGNGSGVRADLNHALGFQGQLLGSWVLNGDPLSTAINSRGEPAGIGDSRAVRFDSIHAGGHPSFIVNALNLGLMVTLSDELSVTSSIDFLPRDRDISSSSVTLGDFFDLKLAFARYQTELHGVWLGLYAGKFESLLGVEYRTEQAPDRLTITPSVICRYTCGYPVGLKVKAGFFERRLEVGLALTNGSHQSDLFPFSNETEFNSWKTVAGRLQYRIPVGNKGIELSASGAIGPQDRQSDDRVLQWHYGFAALSNVGDFLVSAEFVTGRAMGKYGLVDGRVTNCADAACLFYRGAYGQVGWRANNIFIPYARVDWRSAEHRQGVDYMYLSNELRATLGVRAELGSFVIVKAEYVINRETWPFEFPDDVFTSSLVIKY